MTLAKKTDFPYFSKNDTIYKKIFLANKLLDFVSPDKGTHEELGTIIKPCITFLLRSG